MGRDVAVALVAVSPALVYYSTDAKQYSGDAMAVVVLAWMAVRALELDCSRSSVLVWSLALATLVWFSFPAVLAAGSGSVVLLVAARHSRRDLVHVVLGSALWFGSFGIEYLTQIAGSPWQQHAAILLVLRTGADPWKQDCLDL